MKLERHCCDFMTCLFMYIWAGDIASSNMRALVDGILLTWAFRVRKVKQPWYEMRYEKWALIVISFLLQEDFEVLLCEVLCIHFWQFLDPNLALAIIPLDFYMRHCFGTRLLAGTASWNIFHVFYIWSATILLSPSSFTLQYNFHPDEPRDHQAFL